MEQLVVILTFATGFLAIFAVNLIIGDILDTGRRRLQQRLEQDARLEQNERAKRSLEFLASRNDLEGATDLDAPTGRWERWCRFVEESGIGLRPVHVLLLCALSGLLASASLGLVTGYWIPAALLAPLAAGMPVLWVRLVRARRLEKLLSQLPDAFDLMSRTLRSGQTTSQALLAVADEFSSPIADEFGYCYHQQNLGLSPEVALRELARRTGLLEIKIFVLAVMVHRQTGGNFAELLEKLAAVIRDRYRIRGIIKALTADGRLQAAILLALPPGMLVLLSILHRSYVMTLFDYPILLAAMFTSMTIGALWMRSIVRFDF